MYLNIHTLVASAVLAVSVNPVLSDEGRGQSIMFENEPNPITTAPKVQDEKEARCAELSRQVQRLQGKPQRKYTAMQRYEVECTNTGGL